MSDVVVVAEFTEWLSATLHLAIRTDRSTTVGAVGHGMLAAGHTYVAVTGYVFNLTEWIHFAIAADLDSCPAFRLPAFFFFELGVGPSPAALFLLAGARFLE